MNCPNCQQPLRDDARFCANCGSPVHRPDSSASRVSSGSSSNVSTGETAKSATQTDGTSETVVSTDPLIGRTLDSKYQLLARLGEGGMGLVYRARRTHIGDEVAVKILHARYVADAETSERFRREARAAAMLHHPNVVAIYDYGETRGEEAPAYIVMELVGGESLRQILQREGRFAPARAVALMRDICAGVGAAHRHHIVHRDLKPDNIIVLPPDDDNEHERAKVVDFGIAKLRDMAAGGNTLTQVGAVVGTPYYMSPEQCRGESLDARSDVYSLGAMLYEMLAGSPPFTAPTFTGIIAKHLTETPPPLVPGRAAVPPALEAVVMRALAKDPQARQADATVLARELQTAIGPAGSTLDGMASGGKATATTVQGAPSLPAQQTAPPYAATNPPFVPTPQTLSQTPSYGTARVPAPPRKRLRWVLIGGFVLICGAVILVLGIGLLVWLGQQANQNTTLANNNINAASPTPSAAVPSASRTIDIPPVAGPSAAQRAEAKVVSGASLNVNDLTGLSVTDLRYLRNAVYARHGRAFNTPELQQYFNTRAWYRPRTDYSDTELTATDLANINLLKAAEGGQVSAPNQASAAVREVSDTLNGWASSIRARDLNTHMSYYAATLDTYYTRSSVSADVVRADIARAFAFYSSLDVELSGINVTLNPTETRAIATFDKTWNFSGPKPSSGSVQEMVWLTKYTDGHWRITGEKDLQINYKSNYVTP